MKKIKKNIFITGGLGQDGKILIRLLNPKKYNIYIFSKKKVRNTIKRCKIFNENLKYKKNIRSHFQKIKPFSDDQWDKRNQGWVHQDIDTWFGGIVYLSKNPCPNSGTSVFTPKHGFSHQRPEEIQQKEKLYKEGVVDIDEYNEAWDSMREQYTETVTVENIYNRFVLFSGKTHHGVKTFGTKPRLTLNFFGMNMTGHLPPLLRTR